MAWAVFIQHAETFGYFNELFFRDFSSPPHSALTGGEWEAPGGRSLLQTGPGSGSGSPNIGSDAELLAFHDVTSGWKGVPI